MHWVVEPEWKGRAAVIVAGGASFTTAQARLIGMARAADAIRVIAINDSVYPCWFADCLYACDIAWWRHHGPLPDFPGRCVSLDNHDIIGVDFLNKTGHNGFDPDPGSLRSGGNSGYQAIHLAIHLGVKKIILLGYDMHGSHWFGDHPNGVRRALPSQTLINRKARFADLLEPLRERGIEIVNATPGSVLGHFPRGSLETELEMAKKETDKRKKKEEQEVKPNKTVPYVDRAARADRRDYRTR